MLARGYELILFGGECDAYGDVVGDLWTLNLELRECLKFSFRSNISDTASPDSQSRPAPSLGATHLDRRFTDSKPPLQTLLCTAQG